MSSYLIGNGATVAGGPQQVVEDLADGVALRPGGGASLDVTLEADALESEGRAGIVAKESLAAGGVGAVGADGGVHAEAAAGLPGEHVGDGEVVEEAAPLEEAEHATLQGALEAVDVVGGAVCRLVEGDRAIVVLGEDAVWDDDIEVEVKGRAEAVQEGDGAELGVAGGGRAGAPECGASGAQEDAENVAREARVVRQERSDPLGQGEHPLADGQQWQDMGGEVGGDLDPGSPRSNVAWGKAMRRALREGQTPRSLQEKATRRSGARASQRMRAKPRAAEAQETCTVARIVDGDTLVCTDSTRVRLLLIDAPEISQEPYGRRAAEALTELLPVGSVVELEQDVLPVDRYVRVRARAPPSEDRDAAACPLVSLASSRRSGHRT